VRCLSKSWASILSRPYFTDWFLTNSFNHPRLLFIVQVYGGLVFFPAPQTPNAHAKSSLVTKCYKRHSSYSLDIYFSLYGLPVKEDCDSLLFDVRSEKFSFINIDDESMAKSSTLINYKGRLGAVQFTCTNQRTLRLWLLEDAAGINKWSTNIYELPPSWKHPCTNRFKIVGMTRTCHIVLSPCMVSDAFYVIYYKSTISRGTLWQKLKYNGCSVEVMQFIPFKIM
ncbi:hypothetical protein DY000_02061298, partial [Brassica cretica]